jgi:hypothetical protein
MYKKIATGLIAVAATTAVALSLPSAASAASYDYSESFGPVYAQRFQAKAEGRMFVDWDRRGRSNEVAVTGRLQDLDRRSYEEGGKCAYVTFQASDFRRHWNTVYTDRYCGFPGSKRISFREDDVRTLRVRVCQVRPQGGFPTNCGSWEYLSTR